MCKLLAKQQTLDLRGAACRPQAYLWVPASVAALCAVTARDIAGAAPLLSCVCLQIGQQEWELLRLMGHRD